MSLPNVLDHVLAFGSQSLAQRAFDALDALVLSQLVYMPLEGFLPAGACASVAQAWDHIRQHVDFDGLDRFQKKRYRLFQTCAGLDRYRTIGVSAYVNRIDDGLEMQFCACTYHLSTGVRCIAFRGTDLSIVGWKEDLNMSFSTVPSQTEAAAYVDAAARTEGDLRLLGHSKGGNLAVYAASCVSPQVQARILRAYSFDGPGLDEATMHSEGYQRIAGRIESYIPHSSVVGMLLHYHPVYTVVRAGTVGILQHDAMTWQVEDGDFVRMAGVDLTGKLTDETIHAWLAELDLDERRLLVDTLYQVVDAAQAEQVTDLISDWRESANRILEAIRDLEPAIKKSVGKMLRSLFSTGADEVIRLVVSGLTKKE